MQYKSFSSVKNPVSKIIYGTSSAPFFKGESCDVLLDCAINNEITAFDTARVYGKAENVLGNWIEKRGNRDKITIISKGGHPNTLGFKRLSEKQIFSDVEKSLSALKTSFIDIYLLHRDDLSRPVGEMVEALNALHVKGKIGAFGGSNWSYNRIIEANEYAYKHSLVPFTFSSPYYGLAEIKVDAFSNGLYGITGDKNAKEREWYKATQTPVIAYSILGHGVFSGKAQTKSDIKPLWASRAFGDKRNFSKLKRCRIIADLKGVTVAQVAIAWALLDGLNCFAVTGASSVNNIKNTVGAIDIKLSEKEREFINLQADVLST